MKKLLAATAAAALMTGAAQAGALAAQPRP